jgi:hypothetical protein
MTMGMVLEATRDYLRQRCELEKNQCGIQYLGNPPPSAVNIYVTINDDGMDTGDDTSYYLREITRIEVGVWRQPNGIARDRAGEWMLPENIYGTYLTTIEQLERKVIQALAWSYSFLNFLNEHAGLPMTGKGGAFKQPLRYVGRAPIEAITVDNGTQNGAGWIGRRLRFRGAERIQRVDSDLG